MPRDRTAEFNNAVRSLQGRQIARAVQVRDVKKVKALQSYGEFMMIAKSVGLNISNTYAKLEKLTLRKLLCFYKIGFYYNFINKKFERKFGGYYFN